MFQDRAKRQKLKNILLVSSVVLAILFVLLFAYGFISVRPQNMSKAAKLGQFYEFNSSALPSEGNTIMRQALGSHRIMSDDKIEDNEILGLVDEPTSPLVTSKKSRIAILVTNLGLNPLSTELSLSLPREVSLGFVPYTTSLKPFLSKAHENGHEIFMYLPFETKKYPDDSPGQMPLLLSLSDEENIRRMRSLLNAFDGYVGVYGAPNEVFTSDHDKISTILGEISIKKLKLFTSNNAISTGEMDDCIISSTIIIDSEPTIPAIKKQLDALVELANSGKPAIGYSSSYPVTIYTLKAWLPTLEAMGIEIVPVTSMISHRGVRQ